MNAGSPDPGRAQNTESALSRWRGGDRKGLDEICARYQPGLEVFLRLYHRRLQPAIRQKIEVVDVIQETWARACAKVQTFEYRGQDSFRRWIWDIALNVFHEQRIYWRAKRRDPGRVVDQEGGSRSHAVGVARAVSPDHGPASMARISEGLKQTLAILERLPKRHRLIVQLADFYDETWKEIADATHSTSAEAVRKEYQLKILPTIERLRTAAAEQVRSRIQ